MQALSESKKKVAQSNMKPNLTEEQEQSNGSQTDNGSADNYLGLAKKDPDQQIQMRSVQSLITLQGKANSKDSAGKRVNTKGCEQLSQGEVDDFSLFQQPLEGAAHQGEMEEADDVNNTFQEINQSVDQVCQDDPDFQSILSNRMQAQRSKDQAQLQAQQTAAQDALLQKASSQLFDQDNESSVYLSSDAGSAADNEDITNNTTSNPTAQVANESSQNSQTNANNQANNQEEQKAERGGHHNDNNNHPRYHLGGLLNVSAKSGQQSNHPNNANNEASKTARMHQNISFMSAQGSKVQQRTAKSSTRQKRPPISFALPTFSNEVDHTKQEFEIAQQNKIVQKTACREQNYQDGAQQHREQLMQSLQPKLHINLQNLPSTSGGSSSYSNKGLSERLQSIIRQRNQGHLTAGVSPTLQPASYVHCPNDGLDMDSSNRTGTERDDPMLLSGYHNGASPLQKVLNQSSNMPPPMPANLSQDPYFYLQWRQQKHKSCRSAHPNHQANYLLAQRKTASPGANNAHTLRVTQIGGTKNRKKGAGTHGKVNDSTSSYSNSSQTTVPIKSLTEVKNPSNLITFRFVNRRVTHLKDIGRFRNLTELDVNGNLLQSEVPELINLPFLKKLNLSGNQIREMWALPKTLEILNLSYNCLKKLDVNVMRSLSNLTTIDISNNGMESFEGLENVSRLKRLIARNNQIQSLEPICNLQLMIEIDLENNPIDSAHQVLKAVQNKKDILILNLKLAPLMVKIQNFDEFIESVTDAKSDQDQKLVQDFQKLLTFLHNGTFYRRKKIYVRIRQQLQSLQVIERKFSNFSNDEDSSNGITHQQNTQSGGAFSHLQNNLSGSGSGTNPYRRTNDQLPSNIGRNQRTNSTGLYPQHKKTIRGIMSSNIAAQRSQRYEAIISLYDKLLEDEDKLLLQAKKKEARERKLKRQQLREAAGTSNNDNQQAYLRNGGYDLSEEEDDDIDDDGSIDMDDDDFDDDLLSDEFNEHAIDDHQSYLDDPEQDEDNLAKGVDLDDLQTYHNQHFGVELNASTADFNKEIKQINQQLLNEGHFDTDPPNEITTSHAAALEQSSAAIVAMTDSPALVEIPSEREDGLTTQQSETKFKESSGQSSDQIDTQEISVVVPQERSSRYTNRQHHAPSSSRNMIANNQPSVVRSTAQPNQDHVNTDDCEQDARPDKIDEVDDYRSESQAASQSQMSKKAPSFKLDLAKLKTHNSNHSGTKHQAYSSNRPGSITAGALEEHKHVAHVKIKPKQLLSGQQQQQPGQAESSCSAKDPKQLMSVRKIQNQIALAQISERIPIKKSLNKSPLVQSELNNTCNNSGNNSGSLETSYLSGQIVKKQKPIPFQTGQKQVHIPKLALQNIHRQPSEQSHNSNQNNMQWKQTSSVQIEKVKAAKTSKGSAPKHLKILNLSKREDSVASSDQVPTTLANQSQSLTLKQSQIIKTLQGKELLDLYDTLDLQRKLINDCKKVLGDVMMTDKSVIVRIVSLQEAQKLIENEHSTKVQILIDRHQMQIEDMTGQMQRLMDNLSSNNAAQVVQAVVAQNVKLVPDLNFLESLEKINEQKSSGPNNVVTALTNEQGGLTLRLKDINKASAGLSGSSKVEQMAILELLNQSQTTSGGNVVTKKLAQTGRNHKISSSSGFQKNLLELHAQKTSDHRQTAANQARAQPQRSNNAHQQQNNRSNSRPGQKNSGHHSRRDSSHMFELSSKREFMDLCQSPTGQQYQTVLEPLRQDGSTLERASNQDDILAIAGKNDSLQQNDRDKQTTVVSDFQPIGAEPSSQETVIAETTERQQDVNADDALLQEVEHKDDKSKDNNVESKEDSFRRVGFFLEKIKERNSSLQERLNLSFKKSSRLDHSSISYRPTTSLNKKQGSTNLRGTFLERDCISLTRDPVDTQTGRSCGNNQKGNLDQAQPVSKTPNIVNQSATQMQIKESDSLHRLGNWDGRKPQIVRQMPHSSSQYASKKNTAQDEKIQKKSLVSPTNNYIDFLQTGTVETSIANNMVSGNNVQNNSIMADTNRGANSSAVRSIDQANNLSYQQQQQTQKSVLAMLEDTSNHVSQNNQTNNPHCKTTTSKLQPNQQTVNTNKKTNLADQTESGPLFNFYQCTEVLYQLSTTSRGTSTNPHSSKNRSFVQRGGSGDCIQHHHQQQSQVNNNTTSGTPLGHQQFQQYSSLLKQRSNKALMPQQPQQTSSSLLEHATAAQVIKQGTSIIQRASSLEMVPRLTPKQNNYLNISSGKSSQTQTAASATNNNHQQQQQSYTQQQISRHPQGSKSGSQSYWTQAQQIALEQSSLANNNNRGVTERIRNKVPNSISLQTTSNKLNTLTSNEACSRNGAIQGASAADSSSAQMLLNHTHQNKHHASGNNNALNKSLQTYHKHYQGGLLNNNSNTFTAGAKTPHGGNKTNMKYHHSIQIEPSTSGTRLSQHRGAKSTQHKALNHNNQDHQHNQHNNGSNKSKITQQHQNNHRKSSQHNQHNHNRSSTNGGKMPPQKVLGAKSMVEKLQLQLKGLGS